MTEYVYEDLLTTGDRDMFDDPNTIEYPKLKCLLFHSWRHWHQLIDGWGLRWWSCDICSKRWSP